MAADPEDPTSIEQSYLIEDSTEPGNKVPPSQVHDERVTQDTKVCPDCAETIKASANVCRYCGHRFDSAKSEYTYPCWQCGQSRPLDDAILCRSGATLTRPLPTSARPTDRDRAPRVWLGNGPGTCPTHGQVLGISASTNHIFHLLMTLISFGCWIPVWIVLGQRTKVVRCPHCGTKIGRV